MSDQAARYVFQKELGAGAFGKVLLGKDNVKNQNVAIKRVNISKLRENSYLEQAFWREIDIMASIKSKYSVQFIEKVQSARNYNIVMELCDGDLYKELMTTKGGFSVEKIRQILCQLNEVFYIMYHKNIVHRDLKLQNIFIKYTNPEHTEFDVKLGDFGFGKVIEQDVTGTKLGTPVTMAPEVLRGKRYTNKADLWSIGVIIYQLHSKTYPFLGMNEKMILQKIQEHKLQYLPSDPLLSDLIQRLLTEDAIKRISWDEYFAHPFFGGKQWGVQQDSNETKAEKMASIYGDVAIQTVDNDNNNNNNNNNQQPENSNNNNTNNTNNRTLTTNNIKYELLEGIHFGYKTSNLHMSLATHKDNNNQFLVKKYPLSFIQQNQNQFAKDILISRNLKGNSNAIHYVEHFQTQNYVYVVYEYIPNAFPLAVYTTQNQLTENQIKRGIIELLNNIFISAENHNVDFDIITEYSFLFLSNKNRFILSDFGFLKCVLEQDDCIQFTSLNEQNHLNNKTNILNFGVSLYNVFFNSKLNFQSVDKSIPIPQGKIISKEFGEFLSKVMTKNPNKRPNWREVRQHPFLQNPNNQNNVVFDKEKLLNIIEGLQNKYVSLVSSLEGISKDNFNKILSREFLVFLTLTFLEMIVSKHIFRKISKKEKFSFEEELSFFKIKPKETYPLNLSSIIINLEQISLNKQYILFTNEVQKQINDYIQTIEAIQKKFKNLISTYNKTIRYTPPTSAQRFIDDLVQIFRSQKLIDFVQQICDCGYRCLNSNTVEERIQSEHHFLIAKIIEEFIISIRTLALNKVEYVNDRDIINNFFTKEGDEMITVSIDQLNIKQEEYIFVSFMSCMFRRYFKDKGIMNDEGEIDEEQNFNKYGITQSVANICSSNINCIIDHYLILIKFI